jgi:phospholipid/cholesterol/gamma-HCH transport system substrate-binding protein
MIKISNEVKVGAVALITIVVFIWLYNFLKGKDYFKSTAYYYSVFDKVGGLAESSPVEINGYKVGVVQSIEFLDPTSGRLLVVYSVSKDFILPKNTVAEIVPVSIIAGMKVQFVYGDGPGFYSEGDTIPGKLVESLLATFEKEFVPIKVKTMELLNLLDSVTGSINDILNPEFRKNLNGTMANLNGTTESLDNIIGSREQDLRATIDNLNRFSKMLADNSGKIDKSFTSLESITDTLASADIYNSVLNLKESLQKTSTLLENLNDGKGSAGQLLTNDSLYQNLSTSLASLNELLTDMKANPKRYVHFSIFGKKNIPAN